jgi:hypothetical protein
VSCNCNCKPTQAPQSAAALLTSHHAAVSREQRDPLAHAENWFCINPGGSHEIQRLLSFGWVRERKQSTPCTFFHRTGGKKSRCRMIEFSELQSYYCQSICQRMFFSVLSTAKSIPEQMSKSQRCNFLHAAFRFSPHPPINPSFKPSFLRHHQSVPDFHPKHQHSPPRTRICADHSGIQRLHRTVHKLNHHKFCNLQDASPRVPPISKKQTRRCSHTMVSWDTASM